MTQTLEAPSQTGGAAERDDKFAATELQNNVAFVAVNVHYWRGRRKAKNAEIRVLGATVDDALLTQPYWALLPEEWRKKLGTVENGIRNAVARHAVHFPLLRGVHIVPRDKLAEMSAAVEQLRGQFHELVEQLCEQWPSVREDVLRKAESDGQRQTLRDFLPLSASTVRNACSIDCSIIPIRLDMAEGEGFALETVRAITEGLQGELEDAVDNLLQRIRDRGVIRGGTLDAIRRSFDKLQGFDFAMSAALRRQLHEARESLDASPQELNQDLRHGNGRIVAGLKSALQDVRRQCEEDLTAVSVYGRAVRTID